MITIDSPAAYQNFVSLLFQSPKPETVSDRQKHLAVLNTNREVIGVTMSKLRWFAKEVSKGNPEGYFKFASPTTYEEAMIYGLVVAQTKDAALRKKYLPGFIEMADSWSLCDSVIATMKFLNTEPYRSEYFSYFLALCHSEREYTARFGLVTLMTYYLDMEHIDTVLEVCQNIQSEQYYVQMAVAWLLSFAYIGFKNKTLGLLKAKTLPKFVQNKTISKCRDSYMVSASEKVELKLLRK